MAHIFRGFIILLVTFCAFIELCGFTFAQKMANQFNQAVATAPSLTDPAINTFDNPHYSWAPRGNARKVLLLFLPGTGGIPRANFSFTQTAAAMGFHTIFLMYPDDVAAQQMCSRSSDPDATMNFRLDIIQGGERTPRASSILNRFCKLLQYLAQRYPEDNWGRFLLNDGTPDWSRVIVAGQSQGGGHAYVLGKLLNLNKVVMFGSPKDYSFYFKRTARGFDDNTKTPLSRFYAFNHRRDPKGPYDRQLKILDDIGLTKYGVADVNQMRAPYNNAHVLFTDEPVTRGDFHSGPVSGQLSVCAAVWNYMLNAQ